MYCWRLIKVEQAGGSCGIDEINFSDIEESGVGNYLGQIQEELLSNAYRPLPVKNELI